MSKSMVSELREARFINQSFLRVSTILKNVPLAPNPKRAILITINDK